LGALPPVIAICSSYIEQFPEGAQPATLHIVPRKVTNRLGDLRETWVQLEGRIRSPSVRDAYDDIGVDRLLRDIPRAEDHQTDFAGLVPPITALRASLQALHGTIQADLR
jgi:hypothetical protein